jgi:ATP-binding cassette subfamily C (CFTR/MRP) protein 1
MIFNEQSGHKSANLALSIFTLITMTSELSFNIRQTLTVELNMISLEKVLSYKDVPTEDLAPPAEEEPALMGDIAFQNVKLKYPGSNNYCLNNLNMTIKEGEKIALMGRTGAGKSSIFLALYRLFDIEPDSTITIGGRDIRTLDLYTLRKKCLSSSVQDPIKLLPLTSDCSPSQLKYKSIVDGDITPVKCLD